MGRDQSSHLSCACSHLQTGGRTAAAITPDPTRPDPSSHAPRRLPTPTDLIDRLRFTTSNKHLSSPREQTGRQLEPVRPAAGAGAGVGQAGGSRK